MIIKNVIVEVRGLPITLSNNVKAIGVHGPLKMTDKDIFTCIAKGAYVWEVQEDGSRVKLDFTNYNQVKQPVSTPQLEEPDKLPTVDSIKEDTREPQYNKHNNKKNRNRR